MARDIAEIQTDMVTVLRARFPKLSTSAEAEWRHWTHIIATAIHSFEVLLDLFRSEMDTLAGRMTAGSIRWYAEMCYRFQNGHQLLFDRKSGTLAYADDDPASRIVAVAAVNEHTTVSDGLRQRVLSVKVAKTDDSGTVIPLDADELHNFTGYMDSIKMAGTEVEVISTTADLIRYDLEVFYSPMYPATTVREEVLAAVAGYKTSLSFDARFYPQKLLDAVLHVEGVETATLHAISRKGATDSDFTEIGVMAQLHSGYFNYDDDHCTLTLTSTTQAS